MEKLTHIKWIGPNDPMIIIKRNDARLYLTKKELFELQNEIKDFIDFYKEDFSLGKINNTTPPEEWISYDKIY